MTTQELKQQIEKVLGNSIRCLLPSYWWKRLFHQVADRIDEVEHSTSELIEASKMPIVASESELSQLDLQKGSVAAVREGGGSTVKISDCYFSQNFEEDWEKYTIVKRVEEKANITIDKVSGVVFSASQKDWLKDAFSVGITADGFGQYVRIIDGNFSETTLSIVNEALSSGKYRAIDKSGEPDQYFTFSGISRPELYIKGETSWERIAKESDLEETSSNSLFFYAPVDANTEISDVEKQHNAESYLKIAEGFESDKYYDVKVLMSTSQLVTFDAIQILNPAIDDGKLKLLFRWVDTGREQMVIVTSDGSATIEDVGTSTIDTEMSDTSTNPVQNKAIKSYVDASSANVKAYTDVEVAKKVDKVEGKQLSTEDFTTALKTKLEGLNNYDDTELSAAVARLRDDFDSLTQDDISAAIENFNEIISFLDGIEDSESLDSTIASIERQIANKQDKIEDLETIRSGAACGATALQEHQDISHLATKEEVTNLQNEVIANEEVSAAAFNEINDRINAISENVSGTTVTKEEFESTVETINQTISDNKSATDTAIEGLETSIGNVDAKFANYATTESLNGAIETITNTIIENEEITAAALTDLDARIKEIIARIDVIEGNN